MFRLFDCASMSQKKATVHELTADDVVNEDTLRAHYVQPFMFYIHANVVINLLTWCVMAPFPSL